MKRYLATAPLSDRAFSAVLMRNLIKCISLSILLVVLISFLLSNGIAALYYGFENISRTWEGYVTQETGRLFTIGFLILIACWAGIANSVSVFWTGHKTFCATIIALFIGAFFGSIIVLKFLIPSTLQVEAEQAVLVFLSCCILGGTITAYYIARRKDLVPSTTVWIGFLFSVIVPLLLWNYWKTEYTTLRLFLSSALILAVTPFATIPLALSWNRHR